MCTLPAVCPRKGKANEAYNLYLKRWEKSAIKRKKKLHFEISSLKIFCIRKTNISFLKNKRYYLFLYCRGSWIFYLLGKKRKEGTYDDIIKKSARMGTIDARNRCPSVFDVAEKFNTDTWESWRYRVRKRGTVTKAWNGIVLNFLSPKNDQSSFYHTSSLPFENYYLYAIISREDKEKYPFETRF